MFNPKPARRVHAWYIIWIGWILGSAAQGSNAARLAGEQDLPALVWFGFAALLLYLGLRLHFTVRCQART